MWVFLELQPLDLMHNHRCLWILPDLKLCFSQETPSGSNLLAPGHVLSIQVTVPDSAHTSSTPAAPRCWVRSCPHPTSVMTKLSSLCLSEIYPQGGEKRRGGGSLLSLCELLFLIIRLSLKKKKSPKGRVGFKFINCFHLKKIRGSLSLTGT